MTPPPPARLTGYFASDAPVCVIVRRGPTRHTQLILWNTETDEFTSGQWITKGVVYHASLSSNGLYMTMGIMGSRTRVGSYKDTQIHIICKPPYFSAIETYIGPHVMTSCSFHKNGFLDAPRITKPNCPFPILSPEMRHRMNRQELYQTSSYMIDATGGLADGVDQQGRKVRFEEGRVYVFEQGWKEIYDSNPNIFEPVVPPDWATEW